MRKSNRWACLDARGRCTACSRRARPLRKALQCVGKAEVYQERKPIPLRCIRGEKEPPKGMPASGARSSPAWPGRLQCGSSSHHLFLDRQHAVMPQKRGFRRFQHQVKYHKKAGRGPAAIASGQWYWFPARCCSACTSFTVLLLLLRLILTWTAAVINSFTY